MNVVNRDTPHQVLLAEDDPDDQVLIRQAFDACGIAHSLYCVEDGDQLLEHIGSIGNGAGPPRRGFPDLILLDLNLPRKSGREALSEIRSHASPLVRQIPIVVLTTSVDPADIKLTYRLGVNSYIAKPSSFQQLKDIVRTLAQYWFETVHLPGSVS